MKNFTGYLKSKFGDDYILLAGGGTKKVSDFKLSWPTWDQVTSKPAATGGTTTPVYWNGSGFTNCTAYENASVNYANKAGYINATRNFFAYAGGASYVGWVSVAKLKLLSDNYFDMHAFTLGITRNYNSPASESYLCAVTFGWCDANITLLNKTPSNLIIQSIRIARDSTNHYLYIQMYVNPSYTTYSNGVNICMSGVIDAGWEGDNTVRNDLQVITSYDLTTNAYSFDSIKYVHAGTLPDNSYTSFGGFQSKISSIPSFNGTCYSADWGGWQFVMSTRHRNGESDGNAYGFYIRTTLGDSSSLVYAKQSLGTWGGERVILDSSNWSSYVTTGSGFSLPSCFSFVGSDMPEVADNIASYNSAHTMTFRRNAIMIPYQMENGNDGGFMRCRGTSESSTIFELGTWDDYGDGETIQFNYYPTTSTISPTYSVSVPKKSGTLALAGDTVTTPFLGVGSGYLDVTERSICCYGKTGATYINFGYSASEANCGELMFYYAGSASSSNYVGIGMYGANIVKMYYSGNALFAGSIYASNFYTTSDIRKKDNIKSISNLLPIYEFNWKSDGSKSYGFIAQWLELTNPELVSGIDYKHVNYSATLALYLAKLSNIVEETKEDLYAKIAKLENRIKELETK